jgi:small subunit ribosomal protein S8
MIMVMNDPLAAVLSHILNCERLGRDEALVKPASVVAKEVLRIMQEALYIGSAEEIIDNRGGLLKVSLLGKINRCGVVKPRYSVGKDGYEKFEKRYLPAKGLGVLVVSTPKGMMSHSEAKEKRIGGRLIAYCY